MVVVGAILGVAGFAYEQAHADWRPDVTKTALGWQVREPYVGVDYEPTLTTDHLAWQAGPYTMVMDLGSGKARLIGAGRDAQSIWPTAATARDLVWAEAAGDATPTTLVYAYDFSTRRRQELLTTSATLDAPPVVAGATAYWLSGTGSATAVVACDLASGRQRVLARGSGLGPFLLADGSFVAWSRQESPSAPFTMRVLDTRSGTTSDLMLPGQSDATFDAPVLAGGTLVWLRIDKRSANDTITAYDLHTLVARQVAGARGIVGPGFDGTTIVWAQPSGSGSHEVVMGLRLSGGAPFRIADVPGGVQSVMVSGARVAWWAGSGLRSWIETSRLPQ